MENDNDFKEANTNEVVKFYYTMLKERQNWFMDRAGLRSKRIAVLVISNTAILLAIIIICYIINRLLIYAYVNNTVISIQ